MSSAAKQASSMPRKRMKYCQNESNIPSTSCSAEDHVTLNSNSCAILQPNDSICNSQATSQQKTNHHKSGTAITSNAPNCRSKTTLEARHPFPSTEAKSVYRPESSLNALSKLSGNPESDSESQDDSSSNHSRIPNSDAGRKRGQLSESRAENVGCFSCMFPGGYSSYEPRMQSCKSTCCEYISFEQTSGFKPSTDLNEPESRNGCRGTASDILQLVLLNEQKLLMQKKFGRWKVSNENLCKTARARAITSDEKFSISIIPRDVITQDAQDVCLKTLVGNSEPDTSKTFKIMRRASQSNSSSVLKCASDFFLDNCESDSVQCNFFHQVKHFINCCPSEAMTASSHSKTNYKSKPTPASTEAEKSNCRSQVLTCSSTSMEKNAVSLQTVKEACRSNESSSSKSLPKPAFEESEIPYLTVKDPSLILKNAVPTGVIKLFIGDLCNLRPSAIEKHFFYFDSIVHKVNIFGTITSIRKCSPYKYMYKIEDGSGIVSCIHLLNDLEAKRNKCNQFLSQLQSSMMDHLQLSSTSTLSIDEEYESALDQLEAVAKSSLEANLGGCPFKLGSTVSAVGVLVEYRNKKELKLYEIRMMKSLYEMQDWMQELIILYKQVYPKSVKGFAKA